MGKRRKQVGCSDQVVNGVLYESLRDVKVQERDGWTTVLYQEDHHPF